LNPVLAAEKFRPGFEAALLVMLEIGQTVTEEEEKEKEEKMKEEEKTKEKEEKTKKEKKKKKKKKKPIQNQDFSVIYNMNAVHTGTALTPMGMGGT
jgi:outer membrane biosynthesis protein TonB